jgi:dihydrofolate synthase / folylpolyglutamate synthase
LGEADPGLRGYFLARDPGALLVRGIDFGVTRNDPAVGGRLADVFTPRTQYPELFIALHGAHQAHNAAIAIAAVEAFADATLPAALVTQVMGLVQSPGRLEIVGHQPLVVLDGAHNLAGAQALTAALEESFPSADRTIVVGLLREKDPREMLEALSVTSAARVVCCAPPSGRARDPYELAAAARELGVRDDNVLVIHDVADAVERAVADAGPDDQIVVTGSLYVVGAARAALGVRPRD